MSIPSPKPNLLCGRGTVAKRDLVAAPGFDFEAGGAAEVGFEEFGVEVGARGEMVKGIEEVSAGGEVVEFESARRRGGGVGVEVGAGGVRAFGDQGDGDAGDGFAVGVGDHAAEAGGAGGEDQTEAGRCAGKDDDTGIGDLAAVK